MLCCIDREFGSCSKLLGCSSKILFVVPDFACVTKCFFFLIFFNFFKFVMAYLFVLFSDPEIPLVYIPVAVL